jgi:enamine deaminase RidA (YjgF/YER057c/UK114 family)
VIVARKTGEISLLTWVNDRGQADASTLAEDAYRMLDAALRAEDAAILQERVFGSLAAAPDIWRARERVTRARGEVWAVPPTIVEGASARGEGLAGIHVLAARGPQNHLVVDDGQVLGRVIETPGARLLGLADIGRTGATTAPRTPVEDAANAIEGAERILSTEGFSFRDVVRTWFYLRDILSWYGAFNRVRNAAFRRMGLIGTNGDGAVPASTGIAGRNARGGWCALDLLAAQGTGPQPLAMTRLHSQRQSEATSYGSAFARGMSMTLGDHRYLFVSGTASIDDHGHTAHVGDFDAQSVHTIEVIQALLEGAGAALSDIRQAVAFLKDPRDVDRFDTHVRRAGLDGVPLVVAEADVCRENLLIELEVTAAITHSAGAGQ